jgi:hypothetical protein
MIQHFRISLGLSTLSAGFQLPMYHFWAIRLKNTFRLSRARLRPLCVAGCVMCVLRKPPEIEQWQAKRYVFGRR